MPFRPVPKFLKNLIRKLMYGTWGAVPTDRFKKVRYKRIWVFAVLITAIVSIAPLVIITIFNYRQYEKAFTEEIMHPITVLVSTSKRSLEYSLEERMNALLYIVKANSIKELQNKAHLKKIKSNLEESFKYFVDLGLIGRSGNVMCYVGPALLEEKLKEVNYYEEDWFSEVQRKGQYISRVFKGHRGNPHFVIAIRTRDEAGDTYILRATLDMELLNSHIPTFEAHDPADAFIIDAGGTLQTKSHSGLEPLSTSPIPPPEFADDVKVVKREQEGYDAYVMGYAYIENAPFIFVMTKSLPNLTANWLALRTKLFGFLLVSVVLILILVMAVSSVLVSRIREADVKHEQALHQVEYTAKMASIGRLAAGVAHEINNPLAIINEKAGLLHDLVSMTPDFPRKDKSLKIIESILNSVERGSTITHRLLGFARHLDVRIETIDVPVLITEVLGFLEKEAIFRNIEIETDFQSELPTVQSDKGQIQQVFLNIINNAFEAIGREGLVRITVEQRKPDSITVVVADNGPGIDKDDLNHIFDPFFTTKAKGTGLGLSITYGIVRKLRGEINVESEKGTGTKFMVTLPLARKG